MKPRAVGVVVALVGVALVVVSALADPLGIGGVDDTFGWKQITGVVVGGLVLLLGLALGMEWIPRRTSPDDTVKDGSGGQSTTVVTEKRTDPPPP
jgi:hypothetical protein